MGKINKRQSGLLFKYLLQGDSFEFAIEKKKKELKRYTDSRAFALKALKEAID